MAKGRSDYILEKITNFQKGTLAEVLALRVLPSLLFSPFFCVFLWMGNAEYVFYFLLSTYLFDKLRYATVA